MGVENVKEICGQIKDQNGWRIQTNNELLVMQRKPNTNDNNKNTRMGWLSGKNA